MSNGNIERRTFLRRASGAAAAALGSRLPRPTGAMAATTNRKPNILYILCDQWRAQDVGYAGNGEVRTPNIDRLATESVNLTNAVSACPVCSPYRASLLTGKYPLSNGVFVNDVYLRPDEDSFPRVLNRAGYDTGIIGKWHLDGHGSRSSFIPRERRQGFRFWRALECTHDYNKSYYFGDEDIRHTWEGYDAIAQTNEARNYIRDHRNGAPFFLYLSWGPPHAPYLTAPEKYRDMYDGASLTLRPNVPKEREEEARRDIAGYYAHMTALDDCVGMLVETLRECGIEDNTILVFTADHGDMLYSQNSMKKQQPWEESIRVPFLVRYPETLGNRGREIDMPISTPDIMPTLLGLSGVTVPGSVEGSDYSGVLTGRTTPSNECSLIMCPHPFGQWSKRIGGREFRGVRTRRYTYARDLNGPWLLFDNWMDEYQLNNLVNRQSTSSLKKHLDSLLDRKLDETGDRFLPGMDYIREFGYTVDETGTVPYTM